MSNVVVFVNLLSLSVIFLQLLTFYDSLYEFYRLVVDSLDSVVCVEGILPSS